MYIWSGLGGGFCHLNYIGGNWYCKCTPRRTIARPVLQRGGGIFPRTEYLIFCIFLQSLRSSNTQTTTLQCTYYYLQQRYIKNRDLFFIYSATLVLPLLGIRSINRDYYLTASTLFANAHGNQFPLSNFSQSPLSYLYNPYFHTTGVSRPTYGSFFRHAQNKMR